MIKSVTIKDFFSFKGENTIELNQGINILLGINGSGKTSLINAFRLLYEGVCGIGFEKLFQKEWGGYREVVNACGEDIPDFIMLKFVFNAQKLKELSPKSPFVSDVSYRIIIRPLGETNYTLEEKLWTPDKREESKYFNYLKFEKGRGWLSVYHESGIKTEKFAGETSEQELILHQLSDPKRFLPSHTIRTAIAQMALYETFDTSSNSIVREPATTNSDIRLSYNGSNLTALLSNLSLDQISFEKIESNLNNINRFFKGFHFQLFGSRIYMSLLEKNMRHEIGMRFISDGTLRYIILLSILLNKNGGYLIGMDEPEGRLHPDMIHSIAEMIKIAAQDRQLIIATHSPLLLNDFELEDILVFEKNGNNATTIKKYYEEDFPQYEGKLLPGQLWLNGEIGGKRW
ncbi:MAG: AAA family ATPase [Bacteroidales bacterium]|nr:AAA family ATPase [Bacteroidales bacterium]